MKNKWYSRINYNLTLVTYLTLIKDTFYKNFSKFNESYNPIDLIFNKPKQDKYASLKATSKQKKSKSYQTE